MNIAAIMCGKYPKWESTRNGWDYIIPGDFIDRTKCFGWVEKQLDGTYEAGIPTEYNAETDSDAKHLGIFKTEHEAKSAVMMAQSEAKPI